MTELAASRMYERPSRKVQYLQRRRNALRRKQKHRGDWKKRRRCTHNSMAVLLHAVNEQPGLRFMVHGKVRTRAAAEKEAKKQKKLEDEQAEHIVRDMWAHDIRLRVSSMLRFGVCQALKQKQKQLKEQEEAERRKRDEAAAQLLADNQRKVQEAKSAKGRGNALAERESVSPRRA